METGDWRIVMLIDGTDTEGKATYQQIYQHQDGRKACVGPGFSVIQIWNGFYYKKIERLRHGIQDIQKEKKSFVMFFMQPGSSFSFRES